MDNMKDDNYYIQRIRNDLEFMVIHMRNVDIEDLKKDEVLLDSMLFRMIQVSENAKKLSDKYKENRDFIMLYTLEKGERSAIKSRFCLEASLPIQPPYPKVQIRRKGYPKQVWQIQVRGCLRYLVELPYHQYNEHPQKQYPEKREQTPFEVEEEN